MFNEFFFQKAGLKFLTLSQIATEGSLVIYPVGLSGIGPGFRQSLFKYLDQQIQFKVAVLVLLKSFFSKIY